MFFTLLLYIKATSSRLMPVMLLMFNVVNVKIFTSVSPPLSPLSLAMS